MLGTNITHVIYNYDGGIGTLVKNICSFKSHHKSNIISYQINRSNNKYNLFMVLYLYIRLLYKLRNTIDIIYIHGLWGPHLWLSNKKIYRKIIISTHGALDRTSLKKNKYLKSIVWKILSKKYLQNADCIIAGTLNEVSDIKYSTGNIHPPIALIPYGIDYDVQPEYDESIRQRYLTLAKGRKIFLSLSRLDKSKGIDMLIDAFALLLKDNRECILFIAGSGEQSYERELRKKVIDLEIEHYVYFHGHVSGVVKDTIYDVSDIFVLPSLNDGFGLTVLEAYRSRVPVICTNATPFYEINSDNYGWYIQPNKEDLLSAMKDAAKLPDKDLLLMGEAGFNSMKEKYSNNVYENKLSELFSWIMWGTKRPKFIL